MRLIQVLFVCVALCFFCGTASADLTTITVTVDENAHGTINGFLGPQPLATFKGLDPGPGGLANVLQYDLANPPGLVTGDVLVIEPGDGLGDVIRFNATSFVAGSAGSLAFYSSNVGGTDSLADTPSPPTAFYANTVILTEGVILGAVDGVVYTPTAGQPGFVAGASLPVTYYFISDTPEPASIALLGAVVAGLACIARKRARRA